MSKESVSLRLSESIREEINRIEEREGFETHSDATREVLRRGIDASHEESAGEQLTQIMTGIAGVGSVVAAFAVALGTLPPSIVISFLGATAVSSLLWASVRTLEGGDLW